MNLSVDQPSNISALTVAALEVVGEGENKSAARVAQKLVSSIYTRLDVEVGLELGKLFQFLGSAEYLKAGANIDKVVLGMDDARALSESTDDRVQIYAQYKTAGLLGNFLPAVQPGEESSAQKVMNKLSTELRALREESRSLFEQLEARWPELLVNPAAQEALVKTSVASAKATVSAGFLGPNSIKLSVSAYKKSAEALLVALREFFGTIADLLAVPEEQNEAQITNSEFGALDAVSLLIVTAIGSSLPGWVLSLSVTGLGLKLAHWGFGDFGAFERDVQQRYPQAIMHAAIMTATVYGLMQFVGGLDSLATQSFREGIENVLSLKDPLVFTETTAKNFGTLAWVQARFLPGGTGYIMNKKIVEPLTGKAILAAEAYLNIWTTHSMLGTFASGMTSFLSTISAGTAAEGYGTFIQGLAVVYTYLACVLFVVAGRKLAGGIQSVRDSSPTVAGAEQNVLGFMGQMVAGLKRGAGGAGQAVAGFGRGVVGVGRGLVGVGQTFSDRERLSNFIGTFSAGDAPLEPQLPVRQVPPAARRSGQVRRVARAVARGEDDDDNDKEEEAERRREEARLQAEIRRDEARLDSLLLGAVIGRDAAPVARQQRANPARSVSPARAVSSSRR